MSPTQFNANQVRSSNDATRPPRVYRRVVMLLTRVQAHGRTLYFTFPNGTGRARRSRSTFVEPHHVPDFEGDTAWFEMELVEGKPWTFWRAVRQVEPPADART